MAGLIILSNDLAAPNHVSNAEQYIHSCKSILRYCSQNDPQARIMLWIVDAFHEANRTHSLRATKPPLSGHDDRTVSTSPQDVEYNINAHASTQNPICFTSESEWTFPYPPSRASGNS